MNEVLIGQNSWIAMPDMVDDLGLDPFSYRLYAQLLAESEGASIVEISTRELATRCKMSTGKVSSTKKDLVGVNLIRIVAGEQSHADMIEVLDIEAKSPAYAASPKRAVAVAKQFVDRPGFVYVIKGVGTPWYKIGVSISPVSRIKNIAAKAPFRCELIHSIAVDDTYGVEGVLHDFFASKRVEGEWFTLDEDDVSMVCSLNCRTADELVAILVEEGAHP